MFSRYSFYPSHHSDDGNAINLWLLFLTQSIGLNQDLNLMMGLEEKSGRHSCDFKSSCGGHECACHLWWHPKIDWVNMFQGLSCVTALVTWLIYLHQGSPTFLKLRATSWLPSHTKGYQFDTLFWNNKFAQFAFSYIWLLMINDTHLCEDTDHANDFSQ